MDPHSDYASGLISITGQGLLQNATRDVRAQLPCTHLIPAVLVGHVLLQALLAAEELRTLFALEQLVPWGPMGSHSLLRGSRPHLPQPQGPTLTVRAHVAAEVAAVLEDLAAHLALVHTLVLPQLPRQLPPDAMSAGQDQAALEGQCATCEPARQGWTDGWGLRQGRSWNIGSRIHTGQQP